jgi:hypothetical protein
VALLYREPRRRSGLSENGAQTRNTCVLFSGKTRRRPGNTVLGKPVGQRVLHSICTLSIETGLNPKLLLEVLSSAKLLPRDVNVRREGRFRGPDGRRRSVFAAGRR